VDAEKFINGLANSPKVFAKTVAELKVSFKRFEETCTAFEAKDNAAKVGGSTAAAGAVAGVGVVALAPTVAMAVATTLGTASTGAAISALSGAAATNAALAWLGGGALAAGGGGMAAGNALLALAGPVGWGIGGAALVGGVLWARKKNTDLAEEATKEAKRIQRESSALKTVSREVEELHDLTENHSSGARQQLDHLVGTAPKNYRDFSDDLKAELGALVNNIQSLSQLLVRNAG
jgi:hypothetical protein